MKSLIKININSKNIEELQNIEYSQLFTVFPAVVIERILDFEYYKKYPQTFVFLNKNDEATKEKFFIKVVKRIINFLLYVKNRVDINLQNKKIEIQFKRHININTTMLFKAQMLGENYKDYIDLLNDMELFKRVDNSKYSANKYSYTYELNNRCIDAEDYTMIFINENYNIDDINKNTSESFDKTINIDNRMLNTLKNIRLNKRDAITDEIQNFLKKNMSIEKLITRIQSILSFGHYQYLTKGKKVNRLFHHICNLSSIARKHFNIRMFNVDLTNSQPLLLCYLMKQQNIIDDSFFADTQSGVLYEQFLFLNGHDRKSAKVSIFSELLFDFRTYGEMNQYFKEIYPITWDFLNKINEQKNEGGETLACKLQNLETQIFATTPSVCTDSNFLFLLHDSIYFDNQDDTQNVINHLTQKFDEFGLKPSFNFD